MQKITPFLWFDGKAEEAADFYISIFKNSKINEVMRYPEGAPSPKGSVMSLNFRIEGQDFIALNGGPMFQISPAISFFVSCTTQAEVGELWDKLSEGGVKNRCAWLQDKYGVSWQIVPKILGELLQHRDPEKARADCLVRGSG
jgi:predicted 3-demethylubiquinone-9 3-methyltransferase (glyoxalase superfamily)